MNVEVQFGIPFAVGIPDAIAQDILKVISELGLGAASGPQGAGNMLVLVAQPVDISLPDDVLGALQDAINGALHAPAVTGVANPIQPTAPSQPQPQQPPESGTGNFPVPEPGPTEVGGGPWVRNGVYWSDTNYEADLLVAAEYIASTIGHPNVIHFLQAQSREEVGNGRLFTKINNYWNMGAVDSNPQAAPTLPTPQAGGQAWLDFLGWYNPHSTYASFKAAVANGESDVFTLATLIRAGGWATDPNYAAKVAAHA